MMTRAFKFSGYTFPDVTAFLIAGVIVGPYGLGKFGLGFGSSSELAHVAIIFAFDIGSEFKLASLQEMGKAAVFIGVFQACAATLLVDAVLVFLSVQGFVPIDAAIVLGAIASATAPAATLMVVRQFKAKGPVTDLLLPIVALDDAAGLVIFAVSLGVAQALGGGNVDMISAVVNPLTQIAASIALGALMGFLLTTLTDYRSLLRL